MATWSDLHPDVLPYVPGCPDPVLDQEIRQAAVEFFRLFPQDVGHMRCQFAVYAPGGVRDEAHRRENEMGFDLTKQVVETEDYRQSEQSFANLLAAPPGFNVILGSNEIALQRLQRNIAEVLGAPLE